jgi:hypothetical protein
MTWPHCYAFGQLIGPVHRWFAWRPVRLWYGKWTWLQVVVRARVAKKDHLDGPDWQFWTYDETGEDRG